MADILLIDDDALLRAVVAIKLIGAGHQVRCAGDGGEGLAMALAEPPDMVVLDVMMPVMTGPEVLARLREEPATAQVPVLILTALDGAGDRATARHAGATAFLTKPFASDELLARIEAALAAPARLHDAA